jgi:predicted HTH domain antitoxin
VRKETWQKLEKADYDWAHLAYNYWPERVLSQEKAAEITGLSRAELIDELSRRKVPVLQTTLDELIREMNGE